MSQLPPGASVYIATAL